MLAGFEIAEHFGIRFASIALDIFGLLQERDIGKLGYTDMPDVIDAIPGGAVNAPPSESIRFARREKTPPDELCASSSGSSLCKTAARMVSESASTWFSAGQVRRQRPQEVHLAASTTGYSKPSGEVRIVIAEKGHLAAQAPQPKQAR